MTDDSRVRELVALWQQARKRSPTQSPPTAAELCHAEPHLIPIVEQHIRRLLHADSDTETVADPDEARRAHPTDATTRPSESVWVVPLPRVPGYEILEEIGRGGMGVVYKARHIALNRLVALKMILAGAHASGKARARFRIEAAAVAKLQDPHIVQIYNMGEQDGCPYFAMEYMNGPNVDVLLADGAFTPRQAARVLAPIARALHHAHDRGVIHRDLKPANVLLHVPEGKVPADRDALLEVATPKLTDFGLAKELTGRGRLTRSGIAIGTPSYMAPEQALAQAENVGPATDVYGLGALLFEMLNGRPPFDAPSDLEVLEAVVHTLPVFAAHPADYDWQRIEAICLQCLAKKPQDRYATALALAEDFERLLQSRDVRARPTLWGRFASRWLKPKLLAAVAAALALSAALVYFPPAKDPTLYTFIGVTAVAMLFVAVLFQMPRRRPRRAVAPGSRGRPPAVLPEGEIDSLAATATGPPIRIGVLHSLTGTMAVSETTVYEAVLLAIDELNATGGLLGRQVEAAVADGRSQPERFAAEAERLIVGEKVCAVFGCWTSASRRTVRPSVEALDHLLVYPVQYEGLEASPNIFYLGAAPNQQLLPAVEWCLKSLRKRRFFLVGSDYVFPHAANAIIKDALGQLGGEVVGEEYLPLGSVEAAPIIEGIRAANPDVIFNTINGDSNLAFFRALRRARITPEVIPSVSFSLAEHEFRTLGLTDMVGEYAAWSYFQSLATPENREFLQRLHGKFGPLRAATDPMVTAYCAVHLWAQAVRQAKTDRVEAVRDALRGQRYRGPGGTIEIDAATQHTKKVARVGRLRSDGQFDVVWTSPGPITPEPYPDSRTPAEWEAFLEDLRRRWGGRWDNPAP